MLIKQNMKKVVASESRKQKLFPNWFQDCKSFFINQLYLIAGLVCNYITVNKYLT